MPIDSELRASLRDEPEPFDQWLVRARRCPDVALEAVRKRIVLMPQFTGLTQMHYGTLVSCQGSIVVMSTPDVPDWLQVKCKLRLMVNEVQCGIDAVFYRPPPILRFLPAPAPHSPSLQNDWVCGLHVGDKVDLAWHVEDVTRGSLRYFAHAVLED